MSDRPTLIKALGSFQLFTVAFGAAVGVGWRVDAGDLDPRLPAGAEQTTLATWQRHPRATLIEVRGMAVHRPAAEDARDHLVL